MKVYRIETDTGTGPYGTGPYRYRFEVRPPGWRALKRLNKHTSKHFGTRWPSFVSSDYEYSTGRLFRSDSVFGFASILDLVAWFGDCIPELVACGLLVSEYDTDYVFIVDKQLAFTGTLTKRWNHAMTLSLRKRRTRGKVHWST